MKNIIFLVIVALGFWWWQHSSVDDQQKSQAHEQIIDSFKSIRSNFSKEPLSVSQKREAISLNQAQNENLDRVQVYGEGYVIKTLPDDNKGSRHQRFILSTGSSTVLVVHNIDIAPRLENLQRGDQVALTGEYISNKKGGMIHWTHHDPRHHHPDGWLMYKKKRYQ